MDDSLFSGLALAGQQGTTVGPKSASMVSEQPKIMLVMPQATGAAPSGGTNISLQTLLTACLVVVIVVALLYFWFTRPDAPYEARILPGAEPILTKALHVNNQVNTHNHNHAAPPVHTIVALPPPSAQQVVPPEPPRIVEPPDIVMISGHIPTWTEPETLQERPLDENDPEVLRYVQQRESFTKELENSVAFAIKQTGPSS